MERNLLFPQVGGFVHGGDYNPDQWLDRPDILKEDIRMMKKAGINSATLGVFSWSVYEPEEGVFHFDWLQEIMDNLYEEGIYTVLATPSGARPAWLDEKYPEAMRVDRNGVRNHHNGRHNHCMSSPVYREKTALLDRKLAERFGKHPGLILWHISNEFGGECYCPLCAARFQEYLAEKYDHDIDKLNHAWWTTFWSHRYSDFKQIEPPFTNGEHSIMGLNLDWKRFTTYNMNDFMKSEIAVLKKITPGVSVTTNFMKLYDGLDYRVMAKELDIISWDSYPKFHNDGESLYDTFGEAAFDHAVMRSMKKDKPFMLMESTPDLVNWHPYNKLKRPGIHLLSCLHAIACGSDTVQYFQWRKGRGSFEQFHGAVVDHLGTDDTRVFQEVSRVGSVLKQIGPAAGSVVKAEAALLFDWDNRWAIADMPGLANESKNYEKTCMDTYKEFLKLGVELDVISSGDNFADYKVLVAPMLYLVKKGMGDKLKSFVENGGQLLATYLTGYVDEDLLCYLGGFPGDGLTELFGVVREEIDTLYKTDRNQVCFIDGTCAQVNDYAEILRVKDAKVLASYQEDFYQGTPAVTNKQYGKGCAYYVGARIGQEAMQNLYINMLHAVGMEQKSLPVGVEFHVRSREGKQYQFYLNITEEEAVINGVKGMDLVSGKAVNDILVLPAYTAAVVEM